MDEHPEHVDWATEVVQLALSGASPDEIREKAQEVKQRMTEAYWALFRSLTYVDETVAQYAPDPQWRWGWMVATGGEGDLKTKEAPRRGAEADQVVQVAQAMIQGGARSVNSKAIAERLISAGVVKGNLKNVTIKVSNFLANEGWKRIATSEYAPPEREGV